MVIDLKLGDCKESPPEFVQRRIATASREANFYPRNYDGLRKDIACLYNLDPENVLLTNGTDASIDLIVRTFANRVAYFTPTYYEFRAAAERNNVPHIEIQTRSVDRFTASVFRDYYPGRSVHYQMEPEHDEFFMGCNDRKILSEGTVLFLCNPNNPFGKIPACSYYPLIEQSKGIVAIDEAYYSFLGHTAIQWIEKFSNLLVMRSFSKEYGLAGLRIGYIVGDHVLISKLDERKLFFDVSNVSVEGAKAALEKPSYFKERTKEIIGRREEIESLMESRDLPVVHTTNNNILLHFPSEDGANRFVKLVGDKDIKVNQGNGISTVGLDNSWIRMACGTKEQMKVVKEAINEYEL